MTLLSNAQKAGATRRYLYWKLVDYMINYNEMYVCINNCCGLTSAKRNRNEIFCPSVGRLLRFFL